MLHSLRNAGVELIYEATKDQAVHRSQPLRVVVVEYIRVVMEELASVRQRYHTFCKQKTNHCPPFKHGAYRQQS
ncbi:hypothetical protein TNCV_192251 [Trichonephila clavipes]|nr:hypothetical protein TNCV_192251 [Trichonephila clavipes]